MPGTRGAVADAIPAPMKRLKPSMRNLRTSFLVPVLAVLALMSGCATVPPNAGQDPRDPLEAFNRQVFAFNEGLDKVVLKPLAELYDAVLPVPVQDCLSNGFSNLREPSNAFNNLLQGKGAA